MVNDMKGGNVLIFLSQNEEKCIEELGEFGYIVPPARFSHSQTLR